MIRVPPATTLNICQTSIKLIIYLKLVYLYTISVYVTKHISMRTKVTLQRYVNVCETAIDSTV